MKVSRLLLAMLLAGWAAPAAAAAQGGTLHVIVREAGGAAPVAGAQVRLQGLGGGGVTDDGGVLRLTRLAPGSRLVQVRMLGFASQQASTAIVAGQTAELRFELQREPIALEPVRVISRPGVLAQRGFLRRMQGGVGTFVTRAEIEQMHPRTLSDVLRRQPGLLMTPTVTGASASARGMRRSCPIQYYLDGIQVALLNVDHIPPGDVEGMEIYRGAASIPPAYKQGTALCGVILIWTRID